MSCIKDKKTYLLITFPSTISRADAGRKSTKTRHFLVHGISWAGKASFTCETFSIAITIIHRLMCTRIIDRSSTIAGVHVAKIQSPRLINSFLLMKIPPSDKAIWIKLTVLPRQLVCEDINFSYSYFLDRHTDWWPRNNPSSKLFHVYRVGPLKHWISKIHSQSCNKRLICLGDHLGGMCLTHMGSLLSE